MEEKLKTVAVYVAFDGREFRTAEECGEYEDAHKQEVLLQVYELELADAESEYARHKLWKGSCLSGHEPDCTWYAGWKHAEALRAYRNLLKVGQGTGQSQLDWFKQIGTAASEVLRWKSIEKDAVRNLRIARARYKEMKKITGQILAGTYKETLEDFLRMNKFRHLAQSRN